MGIVYKTVHYSSKKVFFMLPIINCYKPGIALSFSSPRSNYAASTSATQTTDPTARD